MLEKTYQTWCINTAIARGILAYKVEAAGRSGFPDVLLVGAGGVIVFVELKSPRGTGRLSALQLRTINELDRQGADVYVCDSKESFTQVLDSITTRSDNR